MLCAMRAYKHQCRFSHFWTYKSKRFNNFSPFFQIFTVTMQSGMPINSALEYSMRLHMNGTSGQPIVCIWNKTVGINVLKWMFLSLSLSLSFTLLKQFLWHKWHWTVRFHCLLSIQNIQSHALAVYGCLQICMNACT